MVKPIRIKDAAEFDSLMRGLASDIVDAQVHYRLHQALNESIAEYCTELNQSPAFWNLTFSAQIDAALLRLCRAYDSDGSALSLARLLATIEVNLDIFETPHFKQRLSDNPFVESLAEDDRVPDRAELTRNLKLVSRSDPLVSKLLGWRNNIGAHRNPRETISRNSTVTAPLGIDDVKELLERAIHILNTYSRLFRALTYSTSMVGADDYKYVLESIRGAVAEADRRFTEEMAKYEESSP